MAADSDDAPDVLFSDWTTLTAVHLGHNVCPDMILILFIQDDIVEARDRDFLSMLHVLELPVAIDSLPELYGCCQTKILINRSIT